MDQRGALPDIPKSNERKHKSIISHEQKSCPGSGGGKCRRRRVTGHARVSRHGRIRDQAKARKVSRVSNLETYLRAIFLKLYKDLLMIHNSCNFTKYVFFIVFSHFQFGWIANGELINSIAMTVMPLPSLIVINTSTSHHHIPDDEPTKLSPHVIEMFLDHIRDETAPVIILPLIHPMDCSERINAFTISFRNTEATAG